MAKKIKFQIPLQNKGNIDLTNVVTTITVPNGVSFLLASPTAGTYDSGQDEWTVPILPVGKTYTLYIEFKVDDEQQAPYTFVVTTVSDQQADESTPADNTYSRTYTLDDLYPCPNCPPPSMTLTNTTWEQVSGFVDFEPCTDCTTEITLVTSSEVNIDDVVIDPETGYYTVELTDKTKPWSFQVEGNCINCPYWCNSGNDYGPFGPITVSGGGSCCDPEDLEKREAFLDLKTGNDVTLPETALKIKYVFRNGLLVLETLYTFDGTDTITFTEPFSVGEGTYGEDVEIIYSV